MEGSEHWGGGGELEEAPEVHREGPGFPSEQPQQALPTTAAAYTASCFAQWDQWYQT